MNEKRLKEIEKRAKFGKDFDPSIVIELTAEIRNLRESLGNILFEANYAIGSTKKSRVAVGVIASKIRRYFEIQNE